MNHGCKHPLGGFVTDLVIGQPDRLVQRVKTVFERGGAGQEVIDTARFLFGPIEKVWARTRRINPKEHQDGLILAIAAESIVKLIAFLAVGAFVVWGLSGGIGMDMWTDTTNYAMSVDDVLANPLVIGDSYTVNQGAALTVAAPGILGNDTEVYGTTLAAALLRNAS